MKRAQALMAQEEEDSAIVDDDDDDAMDQDAPQANGINGGPHLPSR